MIGAKHEGIEVEQLNALGNAWSKKTGETRWYVNNWKEMIGLEVQYYNTGNVADVKMGGHQESNNWYKKYVAATKVWVDAEGAVHVDYCREEDVEKRIIAAIDARIEALMPRVEEMAVSFAAEPEEPETFEICVVRPTDGAVATVELEDAGDVWESLARTMPKAYDMIETDEVIVEGCPGSSASFYRDEDEDLCEWLGSARVRLEDDRKRILWSREGPVEETVEAAEDEAMRIAGTWGGDLLELQLFIRIGDEEVWSYLDDVELPSHTHCEADLDDDHGCAVSIEADRTDGIAAVTWTPRDGSAPRAMDISLNAGDFDSILLGADPVAEGWEDGCGNLVSWDNAEEVRE